MKYRTLHKSRIEIFTEIYNPRVPVFDKVIEAFLSNILGERARALDIDQVAIKWLYSLADERRNRLLKLERLPAYLESLKEKPDSSTREAA